MYRNCREEVFWDLKSCPLQEIPLAEVPLYSLWTARSGNGNAAKTNLQSEVFQPQTTED